MSHLLLNYLLVEFGEEFAIILLLQIREAFVVYSLNHFLDSISILIPMNPQEVVRQSGFFAGGDHVACRDQVSIILIRICRPVLVIWEHFALASNHARELRALRRRTRLLRLLSHRRRLEHIVIEATPHFVGGSFIR